MGNCLKSITESSLLEPLMSSDNQNSEEDILQRVNKLENDLEYAKSNLLTLETNTYKNLALISEDLNYINEKINEQSGQLSPVSEKTNTVSEKTNTVSENNHIDNNLKIEITEESKNGNDFFLSTQSIN